MRWTNAAVAFTQFAGLKTNLITYTNAFPEISTFEVYTERVVATNGSGATQIWTVSKDGVIYTGGPHSASSQWFLSFGDNSANLDNQNGGFTVFGRVVSATNVFNRLNTFQPVWRATNVVYSAGGAFNELPLLSYFDPLSLAQLYAGLLYVDITELPPLAPPTPAPRLVRGGGPGWPAKAPCDERLQAPALFRLDAPGTTAAAPQNGQACGARTRLWRGGRRAFWTLHAAARGGTRAGLAARGVAG